MSIVHIHNLQLHQSNRTVKIKVRICRIWQLFDDMRCVLIDDKRDTIEAIIPKMAIEFVAPQIQPGNIYEISHFHVLPRDNAFKVVPNSMRLSFNSRTIIKEVAETGPHIPLHQFYFVDYNHLPSRLNSDAMLTDIFGHIKAVQPLEEIKVANDRMEVKCDVYIENIRNEEARITLWGNAARAFNIERLQALPPPVFSAFTSLRVKQFQGKPVLNSTASTLIFFNPLIPETASYQTIFTELTDPVKILCSPTVQQMSSKHLQHVKKYSVEELNILDPNAHKGQLITCKATISRIVLSDGWWYYACRVCYQKLKFNSENGSFTCEGKHNQTPLPYFRVSLVIEDPTDEINVMIMGKPADRLFGISCECLVNERGCTNQQEFPPEVLHTIGKSKIFQLRIGSRNDLLIHTVFDDELQPEESSSTPIHQILPQYKTTQTPGPILPPTTPIFRNQAPPVSSSVSTTTSPPESAFKSNKMHQLAVKRALNFKSIANKKFKRNAPTKKKLHASTTSKIPKKDDSDTDNIPIIAYKKKTIAGNSEPTSFTAESEEVETIPLQEGGNKSVQDPLPQEKQHENP